MNKPNMNPEQIAGWLQLKTNDLSNESIIRAGSIYFANNGIIHLSPFFIYNLHSDVSIKGMFNDQKGGWGVILYKKD